MMHDLLIATENLGKFSEFEALFEDLPYRLSNLKDLNLPQADETACTFVENALIKARHASFHTKKPCIADDSGLIVEALDGQPGIHSARYAGDHVSFEHHIKKLMSTMQGIKQRSASFYCVIVYVAHAKDPTPQIFTGQWMGEILEAERGGAGFGYDPVFYLPQHQKTAAELSLEDKNRLSHRALAMQGLRTFLKK